MARPKEFDVTEALESAMNAFRERGFEATSLNTLMSTTGVQKASLYGTFGDKRHFFLTALAHYHEEQLEMYRDIFRAKLPIRERLTNMLSAPSREDCKACLFINTQIELAPHDPEIALMLENYYNEVRTVLESSIKDAKMHGEVAVAVDPMLVTDAILVACCGLYVTGSIYRKSDRVNPIVGQILALLDG
jgi:TetR/AcrR family transcriptional repressor of nem operon